MTDSRVNLDESVATITSSLLQRAQSRDEAAWSRLVYLYSPLVYKWCRRKNVPPEDAADIGQEVFSAVANKLADFRRDRQRDTFRGWLHAITKNKINDYWRKGGVEARGGSDAQQHWEQLPDEPQPRNASEDTRLLYRRIIDLIRGQFNDTDWRAFERVVIDGQRAGDVAEELGISRNHVYLAKSRILRAVRDELEATAD